MFKKIAKNTTILGLGTLFSRVLGLIRDVLIAKYFGTSSLLEVFIVSFRIPNLLRAFLGEGFSDSIATPYLSAHTKNKKRIEELGNNLISIFLFVLTVVTLGGIFFSRYIVMLVAPGFVSDSYKFNLAVSFLRITFFYILFMGIAANLKSMLYALRKFTPASFVPSLLNISFIIGILFLRGIFNNFVLVVSVVTAGLLQVVSYYLLLNREKIRIKFTPQDAFKDREIKLMFKSSLPRMWSSVVYQLNVLVDTIFSSLSFIVGSGALAAIYYANRIVQFPLALIALSISRVAIVDFSQFHREGRRDDFKKLFIFSFRNLMFFIIPISIVIMFIPKEIIKALFLRGEFSTYSLRITANTLFFYSFGLFFFCGIKLLVNVFYSLKDTLTPAKVSTLSLLVNAVLSAVFMFPLKVGGIALASSIAAALNFFLLLGILRRRIGFFEDYVFYVDLFKLILVGVILGVVSRLIFFLNFNVIVELLLAGVIDVILLFVIADIIRLRQSDFIKVWIRKLGRK